MPPKLSPVALTALSLTIAGMPPHPTAAQPPTPEETRAVDRAHQEIWRRFISPHGTFHDYSGLDGTVLLPTAEECAASKPNALGWWTPIENGPFFGGLYIDALCRRWRLTQDPRAAKRARAIAAGLLRLAEAGTTPGFIARGFADGGSGHFVASSSDQTYPWFYGLWRYATSGLPDSAERQRVAAAMERVARALQANDWKMPCDREDFGHFGHWSGGFAGTRGTLSGAEPQFDAAARLLFVLRALHSLTGDPRWLDLYHATLSEAPHGTDRTRLQICSQGVQYVAPGQPPRYPESPPIWTSASSQAALRALAEMEKDDGIRAQFQRGLDANATSAAPFIPRFRDYDNENTLPFVIDWRPLNDLWKPQAEIGEAVQLATLQYSAWNRQSPRRVAEADAMRDPLFAAWIVALSRNGHIIAAARDDIAAALTHYQWEKLHTCLFFVAECVYWQLREGVRPSAP